MRKLIMAGIALITVAISSCDEDTSMLGDTLTESVDEFEVVTRYFNVTTQSIQTDSVLSTSEYSYLGRLKDPETGAYITSDYMTQFNILENESSAVFPAKSTITELDDDGEPLATSCYLKIMVNAYQGDSLTAMQLNVRELDKPVKNSSLYYTSFNPEKEGYLRALKNSDDTPTGAVNVSKMYSISDLTMSDSLRNVLRKGSYYQYIMVPLNQEYIDKDNKHYNNYGTYLMRKYYENKALYKNANTFVRNVCPGFYFKTVDGQGVMIEVAFTQLVVNIKYKSNGSTVTSAKTFNATQEVLQTTHITNDKDRIKTLSTDPTCTFLKTPAGLFTEVELPILKIKETDYLNDSHVNDTIASAKITFQRIKDTSSLSDYVLEEPQKLLLIPRDSLYTFFEHGGLPDNKISYLATISSAQKTYTFNNITNLINHMYAHRGSSKNWNKAVLVPVQVSYSSTTSTATVASIANEMSLSSVRLVSGSAKANAPVVEVVYNKNK